MARHDAWKFGCEAEDASRKGRIAKYFRDLLAPRADRSGPKSRLLIFLSE
jgi:hypothetical protein